MKEVKNILYDFLDTPVMKEYKAEMEEKAKFIKKGPRVVHLEYIGGMISDEDIAIFENKLEENGLELSRFDKAGVIYACLDDFQLATFLVVSQPIINDILKGVLINSIWETIKFILMKTWKKVRLQNYESLRNNDSKKKEITFGLNLRLDKDTSLNFKLDGDIEEKIIERSLDKILVLIKEQKLNENSKSMNMVSIDRTTNEWVQTDTE